MEDQRIVLPVVNEERCTGCGECVGNCPAGAVQIVNGKVTFTASENCTYCGVCEDVCPEGAVSLYYEIVSVAPPK